MEKIKIKNFMAIVRNNVGNDVWNSTMNSIWSSVGDRLRIIVRNIDRSSIDSIVWNRTTNSFFDNNVRDNIKQIIEKRNGKN